MIFNKNIENNNFQKLFYMSGFGLTTQIIQADFVGLLKFQLKSRSQNLSEATLVQLWR